MLVALQQAMASGTSSKSCETLPKDKPCSQIAAGLFRKRSVDLSEIIEGCFALPRCG